MTEKLPKVAYSSELKMGDLVLKVHVLDDGRRIIEEESVLKFIEWLSSPAAGHSREEIDNLAKFIKGN